MAHCLAPPSLEPVAGQDLAQASAVTVRASQTVVEQRGERIPQKRARAAGDNPGVSGCFNLQSQQKTVSRIIAMVVQAVFLRARAAVKAGKAL